MLPRTLHTSTGRAGPLPRDQSLTFWVITDMISKLHIKSIFFLISLVLLLGAILCQKSWATICPTLDSIISSDPSSDGTVIYLSRQPPGWHSHYGPMLDIASAQFNSVRAGTYDMSCAYDTPTGYLILYTDEHDRIDLNPLTDQRLWFCTSAQSPRNPISTEELCICSETLGACNFTLIPGYYYPY